MSTPRPPLYPHERLVTITVNDRELSVPENNSLLRGLQFLGPEAISLGSFCWNRHCHNCAVEYDMGEGTPVRGALACQLRVEQGMRIRNINPELQRPVRSIER